MAFFCTFFIFMAPGPNLETCTAWLWFILNGEPYINIVPRKCDLILHHVRSLIWAWLYFYFFSSSLEKTFQWGEFRLISRSLLAWWASEIIKACSGNLDNWPMGCQKDGRSYLHGDILNQRLVTCCGKQLSVWRGESRMAFLETNLFCRGAAGKQFLMRFRLLLIQLWTFAQYKPV